MFDKDDSQNSAVWEGVPEPVEQSDFIVDEAKDNVFTVLVDQTVAGYEVTELLYLIGGVWRVVTNDTDDDEEVPSVLLEVTVDRRFKVDEVRAAVIKLLDNLYGLDEE